ncbi:hydroxypyruvate reductase [Clostridium ragsdalei P11]|uniref:Hydroxypyruvate reductase n=1 Tax=Clostridium ragsdalei P11 TaxID=1353534 RepID=A0A1A6B291_9CLOT|nr:phosphoglycerate dehydrogenase [Clostridium ragsdalei]OBR96398.1 hydroxypyruvate reductase [Clostridium ragsdalei P11]
MGIKLLCTRDFGKKSISGIQRLGYDIEVVEDDNLHYKDEFRDAEVLLCYDPFKTLDISKMNKLKWIQLFSVGIDQAPKDDIRKKNIILTNNKGGYSIPMGEWIVLKILEMLKHSQKFYEKQKNKIWKMDMGILELWGKTVGFIGTGSIAKEAASRLKPFGVKILGLNTKGNDVEHFDKCFSLENVEDMLKLSDIVVVSIPYTKKTNHLVNENLFKSMKNGVYIVNIARGSILDEKDLLENIKNGKIAGAALDVVENEPLDESSPFWEFENVTITPHNSWVSDQVDIRRFNMIYDNLKRYASGDKLVNIVDINKGY